MPPSSEQLQFQADSHLESHALIGVAPASACKSDGSKWIDAEGAAATWRQRFLLSWAVVSTAGNIAFLVVLVCSGSPFVAPLSGSSILSTLGGSSAENLPRVNLTEDECVTPAFPLDGPASDWYTLKAIPPPDPCLVRGMVIDKLEPEYNFRRYFTLGIIPNMDDKSYLLPYLCPIQDRTMATKRRRVLLDLGGNTFNSSTLWFLQMYPLSFTDIHVFEVQQGLFQKPATIPLPDNLLDALSDNTHVPGWGILPVPQRDLDTITVHETMVGSSDKEGPPAVVNITRFMLEELGLTADDAVVVKMDIEMAEWDVPREWMTIPEMPSIVDELFVEVHYQHPSMAAYGWRDGPTRDEATALFRDLRGKGLFAHPWP